MLKEKEKGASGLSITTGALLVNLSPPRRVFVLLHTFISTCIPTDIRITRTKPSSQCYSSLAPGELRSGCRINHHLMCGRHSSRAVSRPWEITTTKQTEHNVGIVILCNAARYCTVLFECGETLHAHGLGLCCTPCEPGSVGVFLRQPVS
jgi:hypothetical protein